MNILLTGGTGYIGSAVLDRLSEGGHEVTALVRSEDAAARVAAKGATALLGDVTDTVWLAEQLAGADAAVHMASPGDATSQQVDASIATAVANAFAGTSKPYVHTGGVWVYGNGIVSEDTPFAAPDLVAWRSAVESIVLDADVRASVVVPGVVYGRGKGIPALLAGAPRTVDGALTVIGDGTQHWVTVHVDDIAELYVRVLESGTAQGYVLAADGANSTVRELGEALAGGPVVAEGVQASRERLGVLFADALLLDQQADGAKARTLGWRPTASSLVDEFTSGSYRD